MSFIACCFVLLNLGLTANVYFPYAKGARGMTYSFFAGWFAGELALQLTLVQMLLTLVMLLTGSFSGLLGSLGLLLLFANWLALLHHYYQGRAMTPRLSTALDKGLGKDYESKIDQSLKSSLQLSPDFLTEFNPFKVNRRGVEVISDIPYGHEGLALDIYRPNIELHGPAPVLMHIHGGAWIYGDKVGQAVPLMLHLARLGWVCCSISYRLSPKATHPDHITDCKAALTWIKANIADYGGDPAFIAVTGGSAGGHLSSLLALTPNDPVFQSGFESADTHVQAAVPFYGVFDWTDRDHLQPNTGLDQILERQVVKSSRSEVPEIYEQASPLVHVNPQAPPFMIVHGDKDSLVPVSLGRRFAKDLTEVSNAPVVYCEVPGAQHAFDVFASPRSERVKLGVAQFLSFCYSQHLNQQSSR